ncbi:MAG: hypothetical protein HQ505_04515 [Nitrosopumilus sp.]|nr:hypothetical protein [Nitrosopumilus sp.]
MEKSIWGGQRATNKSYAFIAIDSLFWEFTTSGFFLQFFSCLSAKTKSFSQCMQGVFSFVVLALDFVVLILAVLALAVLALAVLALAVLALDLDFALTVIS